MSHDILYFILFGLHGWLSLLWAIGESIYRHRKKGRTTDDASKK